MKFIILVFSLVFLVSCSEDKQQVLELSDYQATKNAKAQVEQQDQYLKDKAELMEQDLLKRSSFIKNVSGSYKGQFFAQQDQRQFLEMTISPANLPPAIARTRTLEEISYDLNQVSLSVMVKVIGQETQQVISSCRFTGIRPDLNGGVIFLSNQECPNFYSLELTDNQNIRNSSELVIDLTDPKTIEDFNVTWKGVLVPAGKPGKNYFNVKKI